METNTVFDAFVGYPRPRPQPAIEDIKPEEAIVMCDVCGHRGIYRKEIVDADYRDIFGHENTRLECRAVFDCLNRVSGPERNLRR